MLHESDDLITNLFSVSPCAPAIDKLEINHIPFY